MSDSEFVLLESMDGYTFVVRRQVACASGMLKSMLDEESRCLFALTFIRADTTVTDATQRRSRSRNRVHARSNRGKLLIPD